VLCPYQCPSFHCEADTGAASEREAIERAVESYVAQHRRPRARKNMFDLVGEVRLRDDYDYKALRAGNAAD
jgi:hypothetical protein